MVDFRIADTFTAALARLPVQDQKAVKTSAFDLQMAVNHRASLANANPILTDIEQRAAFGRHASMGEREPHRTLGE